MRVIVLLCLLSILAACAAPPSVPGAPAAALDNPTQPTPAGPKEATPSPQPEPTGAPLEKGEQAAPVAAVPLSVWDGEHDQARLHLVDPRTGDELPGFEPLLASPSAFSADGRRLAAVETQGTTCDSYAGGSACRGQAVALHLVELPAGRSLRAELPEYGWAGPAAFSPKGETLALVYQQKSVTNTTIERRTLLLLFDAATGHLLGQLELAFFPELLAFNPKGDALVAYGQPWGETPGMSKPEPPRALRVSVPALQVDWEHTFKDLTSGNWCQENCDASHELITFAYWKPAAVLSHDWAALYLLHADQDRLTSVNIANGAVHTQPVAPARSWLEQLLAFTAGVARAKGLQTGSVKEAVLSPDGTRLYAVGQAFDTRPDEQGDEQFEERSLGLQVVEVATGRLLESRDLTATGIELAPDGAHLLLTHWGPRAPSIQVLDIETLEPVARLEGWEVVVTRWVGGEPVLLAQQPGQGRTTLATVDPQSFELSEPWTVKSYATWPNFP